MKEDGISVNYTREAFLHPLNLGLLFAATLTAFFLSGVGMASNLVLTLAFGTELVYLGIVPRLPRFKSYFRLKKLRVRDGGDDEKLIFMQLDPESKRRFLVMKHLAGLVKQNFDKMPYSSRGLLENIEKKIDRLLADYVSMLDLQRRYGLYMESAREEELHEEMKRLKERMDDSTSDHLKNTKARRLQILRKRLANFDRGKEKYQVCLTQMETIEDAIRYIYEESMTMNNAEEIGSQLDNLLEEVEETSQLIGDLDREAYPHLFDIPEFEKDELQVNDEPVRRSKVE